MDGRDRLGRTPADPADPAGGGRGWRPSFVYLAVAVGVVVGGLGWWLTSPPVPEPAPGSTSAWQVAAAPSAPPEAESPEAPASAPVASAAAPAASQPEPRMREPNGDQTPDLRDYLNTGENPPMAEVIDRLHRAGVTTGLGAFSPPGTRPPLVGLAVPDDFVLPEGYVRHHQSTDDGRDIEPILMYSPDHPPLYDAAQRPLTIPADRVVPPELAPPGLPIRRVVIPAPTQPGRPGS